MPKKKKEDDPNYPGFANALQSIDD